MKSQEAVITNSLKRKKNSKEYDEPKSPNFNLNTKNNKNGLNDSEIKKSLSNKKSSPIKKESSK
jgi:hypothetical protein